MLESFFWMVLNVYHEARGEPLVGRVAVSHVVLNRVENPKRFGATPKEVIQKEAQFSWYDEDKEKAGELRPIRDYAALWEAVQAVSITYVERSFGNNLSGADHYHRFDINPPWNKEMRRINQIGKHIFWKDS